MLTRRNLLLAPLAVPLARIRQKCEGVMHQAQVL